MKICITGGAGFIGAKLVEALTSNGVGVRLVTRSNKKLSSKHEYFVADLANSNDSLNGLFDGIDVVYNCAGEIKNTALMRALHVEGTARLLEEAEKKIKSTKTPIHWVQLSSVGAYGPPLSGASEKRVVTENTICHPVGEYEVTKTIADELVISLAEREPLFTYTILRPSNVIGKEMTNQSLWSLLSMIKKRLFFYIGSRTAIATYIHVDDVVAALVICGSDERARGQVFNLSNDCALSEIVFSVANAYKFTPPSLCVPESLLRFVVKYTSWLKIVPLTQYRIDALVRSTYYPSNKIEKVLGFTPQYAIPQAVIDMLEEKQNEA